MTTVGALIFAHNNDHTDYVSMAQWSAKNIKRHLNIPVHIVTDEIKDHNNTRWFDDYQTHVEWHNQSRVTAYDASPWDRTLLLDADYVVASTQLQTLLDAPQDFLCYRRAYDVTNTDNFAGLDTFGDAAMPMWWATVVCFNKTPAVKLLFDAMNMIRNNWNHYRKIYKINQTTYRNDYALSIALCLLNGHVLDVPSIPWGMASLTPQHTLTKIAQDQYRINFVASDQRLRWIELNEQDFHAMGKRQLGDIVASSS